MANLRKNSGFTVVEAVVSVSVFAVAVSSIIGTYLLVVKVDNRTRADRAVQQNARFITEFLGKEIRNGRIDYSTYLGEQITLNSNGYITVLRLINQNNEAEVITCDGSNITLQKSSGTTQLNSAGVMVTKCAFYVHPSTDPFRPLLHNPPNVQPFVTFVLELESNYGRRAGDVSKINIQTSYTMRDYPSRE
jgi:Tfp pilus assembly protein PilE